MSDDATPKKGYYAREGNSCTEWGEFLAGFLPQYQRKFGGLDPTPAAWKAALRDWRKGNTGWEAAMNAWNRYKAAEARGNEPPLVWIGGNNYAYAGTKLAKDHGK